MPLTYAQGRKLSMEYLWSTKFREMMIKNPKKAAESLKIHLTPKEVTEIKERMDEFKTMAKILEARRELQEWSFQTIIFDPDGGGDGQKIKKGKS